MYSCVYMPAHLGGWEAKSSAPIIGHVVTPFLFKFGTVVPNLLIDLWPIELFQTPKVS